MFQGRRSCVISDLSRLRKLREILVIISCDRVDVIGSGLFFSLLSEISVQQTYYRLANSVLLKFQIFLKLVKTASKYIQNRTGREDQGLTLETAWKSFFFFIAIPGVTKFKLQRLSRSLKRICISELNHPLRGKHGHIFTTLFPVCCWMNG